MLVFNETQGLEKQLEAFFITTEILADFKTCIDQYHAALPSQRTAQTQSAAATRSLEELFAETDELLRDWLDVLLKPFSRKHPDFHALYQAARETKAADSSAKDNPETPPKK